MIKALNLWHFAAASVHGQSLQITPGIFSTTKPSISSHSKPRTWSRMRHLKCFVLEQSVFKTNYSRRLVRGFEWLEILGLSIPLTKSLEFFYNQYWFYIYHLESRWRNGSNLPCFFIFVKVRYNREGEVLNQRTHILSFFNKGRQGGRSNTNETSWQ